MLFFLLANLNRIALTPELSQFFILLQNGN